MVVNTIKQYGNLDTTQVTKQYGVNKGIKMFGEEGMQVVLKELKQLPHNREVISVLDPKSTTREMVQQALTYLMFIKQKQMGTAKGRGCADGRTQGEFIWKEDSTSSSVSLYTLMLTCLIDTGAEGRDDATVNIRENFYRLTCPWGKISTYALMAQWLSYYKIDSQHYRPKMISSRTGCMALFGNANKAIYSTVRAALLF